MIKPRKRFGQNFLRDAAVIQQIINAISPQNADFIVEIGPGQGALTQAILNKIPNLTAIELDRDLVAYLQQYAKNWGNLHIYQADVLQFDFKQLPSNELRLVGNLPYNISTPLLFYLFNYAPQIRDMTFMLQKEVVDRIIAEVSSPNYGRLSVMVQYNCTAYKLFDVAPSAFYPQPKVLSSVVRLIPHQKPIISVQDETILAMVVSMAFAHKRKTLRNNLKNYIDANKMQQLGINPQLRAENLSLADFAKLADFITHNV